MLEDKVVLIIDDDTSLLSMYGERLQHEGMVVEYAKDGEEALNMAFSNNPNIIVLDILMPKKNGLEVLKDLKENESTRNIPVIVLSALNDEEKKKTAFELGAIDYILKSEVLPVDIVDRVSKVLNN